MRIAALFMRVMTGRVIGASVCFLAAAAIFIITAGTQSEAGKGDQKPGKRNEALAGLKTLPYLSGYRTAPRKTGVTVYDKKSAYPGLNLYCSGVSPQVKLMDMEGNIIHEWKITPADVGFEPEEGENLIVRRAYIEKDGSLLAIVDGQSLEKSGLVKLNPKSRILWKFQKFPHHDLEVAEDGRIYILTSRKIKQYPGIEIEGCIMTDDITILDTGGGEIKSVSILDCFLKSDYSSAILGKLRNQGEIFHTNTVEILDGSVMDKVPMFKKGHALISIPNLDLIAIVDMGKEIITWAQTGMWVFQHQPTQLENGNLLLFDNRGNNGRSKVIEFNPLTQEIIWAYRGDANNNFYTEDCGSCQRLPNGNTLITESRSGRIFEVTPGNKIVWEFFNPQRAGKDGKLIAAIFEMIRIDPAEVDFAFDSP